MNNAAADFHIRIAQDAVSNAAGFAEHVSAPRRDDTYGELRTIALAGYFRWHRCAKVNLAAAEFALLPAKPARRTLKPLALRSTPPRR